MIDEAFIAEIAARLAVECCPCRCAKLPARSRVKYVGGESVSITSRPVMMSGTQQHRLNSNNYTYTSGDARDAHFGLGQGVNGKATVTLLEGTIQTFVGISADQILALEIKRRETLRKGNAKQ